MLESVIIVTAKLQSEVSSLKCRLDERAITNRIPTEAERVP